MRDNPKHQKEEAMRLLEKLALPQTELSIEHLPKFADKGNPNKRTRTSKNFCYHKKLEKNYLGN